MYPQLRYNFKFTQLTMELNEREINFEIHRISPNV